MVPQLGLGIATSKPDYIQSKYSQYAVEFDGAADFIKILEDNALKPTNALGVSLWMKPNTWNMTSGSDEDCVIGCLRTGGWKLSLKNTGAQVTTLEATVRVSDTGSGSAGYITAVLKESQTEALNNWVHVVFTYDLSGTLYLYWNAETGGVTNGSAAEEATIVYHSTASTPVAIGADMNNDTNAESFYDGMVDEVAIFNVLLDSNDVSGIFNSGVPYDISSNSGTYDKAANLVWYGKMEVGSGTSIPNSATGAAAASGIEGGLGNSWSWVTGTPSDQNTWDSDPG